MGEVRSAKQVCADVLDQGLELIRSVSDEAYAESSEFTSGSQPGAHLRHLIDYLDCLFVGIDAQRIDYTARKRRIEIEVSRREGERNLERSLQTLESIAGLDAALPLVVRADADEPFFGSTLGRELSFVSGHAIHHFAMMRLTLLTMGVSVPEKIGVSASTLSYWEKT